jgi:hypothetical protein
LSWQSVMLLRMVVASSSGSSGPALGCLNIVLQLQEEYSIFSPVAFFCECDNYSNVVCMTRQLF